MSVSVTTVMDKGDVMSDSREAFEKWAASKMKNFAGGIDLSLVSPSGHDEWTYATKAAESSWRAWQDSRQELEGEPVGTAKRCGYDRDITYCEFEADEVPIGTKLYTHTASSGKQAVYSLVGHFYNRPSEGRIGIEWCCDSLDDGQELYAKQEQDDE